MIWKQDEFGEPYFDPAAGDDPPGQWRGERLGHDPFDLEEGLAHYPADPCWRSTADPDRLEKIFAKARADGKTSRAKYGNPWKLNRGQLADMDKTIQNAKAESRTCNPLFKDFNRMGTE